MLPRPTNGETIPPEAKQSAPNKAEAAPAYRRSQSIAKVVDDVKVSPIMNSKANISNSYAQKPHPLYKATITQTDSANMPMQPMSVPFSDRRNFTDMAAATPIATAFTAKQILKAKGENP